jgi:pheromone shutdown protein TraB
MARSPPFAASFDDPRITEQFCRRIDGQTDDLILLGVVHDHPASIARVECILEAVDPDVLALELPPATIPLYRAYARDGASPPRFGGEMSAAIRTAPDATVTGIDAPNVAFLRRLVRRLVTERASASTVRRLFSSLGGATREVLRCRVAATLTRATSMTVASDDPIQYNCDYADPPERQAAHERSHVASVQALLGSVDATDSALTYRDETREECMADQLEELRSRGDVVAVVGVDHLDPIETALSSGEIADE